MGRETDFVAGVILEEYEDGAEEVSVTSMLMFANLFGMTNIIHYNSSSYLFYILAFLFLGYLINYLMKSQFTYPRLKLPMITYSTHFSHPKIRILTFLHMGAFMIGVFLMWTLYATASFFLVVGVYFLIRFIILAKWLKIRIFYIVGVMSFFGFAFGVSHIYFHFIPYPYSLYSHIPFIIVGISLNIVILSIAIGKMIRFNQQYPRYPK